MATPATVQNEFAITVSQKTGLSFPVVLAWVLSEGGPAGNPLNIGPGRNYGTWQNAASATVALLRSNPSYAPILNSARADPQAQLMAIANSPWDANHYRGATSTVGALLQGVYARVKGETPSKSLEAGLKSDIASEPVLGDKVASAASSIPNAITGALGAAESWVSQEATVGFAYVALTGIALALIVIGAIKTAGGSPSGMARSAGVAATAAKAGEVIPF